MSSPHPTIDIITPEQANTLPGLLGERVRRTPQAVAYRYFQDGVWRDLNWETLAAEVARRQAALAAEGLQAGERVALMLGNGWQWVAFEQAALGLGLVVVPLYVNDRPDNVAFILEETGSRLLLIDDDEQWRQLAPALRKLAALQRVLLCRGAGGKGPCRSLADWLPDGDHELQLRVSDSESLATIVYTSGTVGRPKGVMLSHHNILWNAHACHRCNAVYSDDLFLSFLPLSHTLERTVGYYLPMMAGAAVAYNRAVSLLAEDLQSLGPTVLISVPRIYERIYDRITEQLAQRPALAQRLFRTAVAVGWQAFLYRQGRAPWRPALLAWPLLKRLVADKVQARLGGRLRIAVCGGAPLSEAVARLFIGLEVPLLQGYGMTETSPVVSANRLEDNVPDSVGRPLPDVECRIGRDEELLVKSPGVMLGYWQRPEASAEIMDAEGWLHSGDKARMDDDGHLYITGRLKEIIVLSNGEKLPPADMEMAITLHPLFEQVLICGEGRPYLVALAVLNRRQWQRLAQEQGLAPDDPAALRDPALLERVLEIVAGQLRSFPGYAQVRRIALTLEPWSVENGMLTPTLKLRRSRIVERHREDIEALYEGH